MTAGLGDDGDERRWDVAGIEPRPERLLLGKAQAVRVGDDGRSVLVGELAAVRVADEVRGVRPEHGEVGDRRSFTE